MIIGVPKEIKEQEQRIALVPSAAELLTKRGHTVLVEKNGGVGSGYPDEEYRKACAEIVDLAKDVFARADMIVKVKEPLPAEFPLLRKGQILFTYLHLAASKALTEALLKSGVTAIAYETIQVGNRLPLLEPMSEIAGRMSAVMGAYFFTKHNGGSGVLLGGVPGVLPGRVVVIGGGTTGVNAARMATGLGADVTILEVDLERMRFLDVTMGSAHTLYSSESHLRELMPNVDLLIGAVLVPGAKAPKLITRAMLKAMKAGSVLVDIAIDQGGCATRTEIRGAFVNRTAELHSCCETSFDGAFPTMKKYICILAGAALLAACEQKTETAAAAASASPEATTSTTTESTTTSP